MRAQQASPLGFLIGLSLGALGGGGSILAVPALVYAAGQDPKAATATSLFLFVTVEVMHAIPLHFLLAAIVIFAVSLVALLAGSMSAPATDPVRIAPLMFSKAIWADETRHLRTVKWYQNYRFLSIALLILTAAVVLSFA